MRTLIQTTALAAVLVLSTGSFALAHPAGGGSDSAASRVPTTTGGVSGARSHSNPRMNRMAGSIGGGDSYASAMNPKDSSTGLPGNGARASRQAAAAAGWGRGHPVGR